MTQFQLVKKIASNVQKIYAKVDTSLGGYLPGGVSPNSLRSKSIVIPKSTDKSSSSKAAPGTSLAAHAATTSSIIGRSYSAVDSFFGGYLPGGVTPSAIRTKSADKASVELAAEAKATTAKLKSQSQLNDVKRSFKTSELEKEAKLKAVDDLVNRSGLEYIGLYRSEQEKAYQEYQRSRALRDTITDTSAQDRAAGATPIPFSYSSAAETAAQGGSTGWDFLSDNFGKIALIVGVVVVAGMVKSYTR